MRSASPIMMPLVIVICLYAGDASQASHRALQRRGIVVKGDGSGPMALHLSGISFRPHGWFRNDWGDCCVWHGCWRSWSLDRGGSIWGWDRI
jgi:hypothetical protein